MPLTLQRPHQRNLIPEDIQPLPLATICSPRDLAVREHWDQILYEGLMDGLGYSKNREPFVRLSRNVTLQEIRSHHIEHSAPDR